MAKLTRVVAFQLKYSVSNEDVEKAAGEPQNNRCPTQVNVKSRTRAN
jgi:hypothetical protein